MSTASRWLVLGLLLLAAPVSAQERDPAAESSRVWEWWVFKNRDYYEPGLAEPRAARVVAMPLAFGSEYPYMIEKGRRRLWDISLGKELPIFGREGGRATSSCTGSTHAMPAGCWGLGLWVPVSFHMVEDFKDESVPIVNTDYRFSALIKAVRTVKNGAWAARFQAGHESTHLGDEFTIHAIEQFGNTFERVNVSFEYWELGASRMINIRDTHYLTVRAGAIGLLNRAKGFYGDTLLGSTTPTLTPSTSNLEWLAGLEWQRPDKGLIGPWAPLASVDVRLKTVYNFHRPPSTPDERRLSTGLVVGLRNVNQGFNEPGVPMLIAKVYYGVNPNGQFRSQAKYFQWGLGLLIPM